jgi:hypothetical protein
LLILSIRKRSFRFAHTSICLRDFLRTRRLFQSAKAGSDYFKTALAESQLRPEIAVVQGKQGDTFPDEVSDLDMNHGY